ncbi:NYN domain-containing protein [Rhodobacterales bacterium HKCCE2091]|nr:NYN domain-containing protein [Rhodobacterales bacterium HKCCE2091]
MSSSRVRADRVAVLIDGDNVSTDHADRILEIASRGGRPACARAYAATASSAWFAVPGIRGFHAGGTKNSADILISLDALELAIERGYDSFVLASSDSDFRHIAERLAERGCRVVGVGEAKTPLHYRAVLHEFVELSRVPDAQPDGPSELDHNIRKLIAANSRNGMGMFIASLNGQMNARHGVKISKLQDRTWRTYLSKRPHLYDLDPKGPEARVRFKPEGFAVSAG